MAPLGQAWPSGAKIDPNLHLGLRATFTESLAWREEPGFLLSTHVHGYINGKEAGDSQRDVFLAPQPPGSWRNESVVSSTSPGSGSPILSPEFAY